MAKIPYSDYQREVSVERIEVSYNALTPDIQANPDGTLPEYEPERVKLRALDVARLIRMYTHGRFIEQVEAVVPLALYLVLFQLVV